MKLENDSAFPEGRETGRRGLTKFELLSGIISAGMCANSSALNTSIGAHRVATLGMDVAQKILEESEKLQGVEQEEAAC